MNKQLMKSKVFFVSLCCCVAFFSEPALSNGNCHGTSGPNAVSVNIGNLNITDPEKTRLVIL
jgi:hypothetical protein